MSISQLIYAAYIRFTCYCTYFFLPPPPSLAKPVHHPHRCPAYRSIPAYTPPPHHAPLSCQNIHIGPRKIWLTRPAESVMSDYSDYEIGEEVDELTEEGRRYSMTVARYLQAEQVG